MAGIDLSYDEALYLYEQLRSFHSPLIFPDFLEPEHIQQIVERWNEENPKFQQTVEERCKHLIESWEEDGQWRDMEFYARIVPKLLKAYPELLRMRN